MAGCCQSGNKPVCCIKCGQFLTSWRTSSFSRKTLLHDLVITDWTHIRFEQKFSYRLYHSVGVYIPADVLWWPGFAECGLVTSGSWNTLHVLLQRKLHDGCADCSDATNHSTTYIHTCRLYLLLRFHFCVLSWHFLENGLVLCFLNRLLCLFHRPAVITTNN